MIFDDVDQGVGVMLIRDVALQMLGIKSRKLQMSKHISVIERSFRVRYIV